MSLLIALYILAGGFLVMWISLWVIHLVAIMYGKYKLHRKLQCNANIENGYPGVSILKPLLGVDPNLFSNLETFFTMNYPLYEIHFCFETDSDPALMVVKRLQEMYPNVTSRIFIGGSDVGVNPKINNLQPGYLAATYPLILISDSGIRMKEDTLLDMVEYMKDDVGLVHQMPFTCDREGFPGILEKVYFGTALARIYLAADFFNLNTHTGMSALIRKSLLDEVGGLEAFSKYLAEDFFYAKSVMDRGWRMVVSSQPANQNCGTCQVSGFLDRLQRWAKLRIAMVPFIILFEPLSECFVLGACAAWAIYFLLDWDPLLFYLVHTLVWFFCDYVLLSIIQNGSLPFNKFDFVIGWIFREVSGPYLFVLALFNPVVKWRAKAFRLKWGGIAEKCTECDV